jgi:cytidine deaminase
MAPNSNFRKLITFIYDNFNVTFNAKDSTIEQMFNDLTKVQKFLHFSLIYSRKTKEVLAYSCNYNLCITKYLNSVHAEDITINKLISRLINGAIEFKKIRNGVELVSLRIDRNGNIRNGMPCIRCANKILKNKKLINKVIWSDDSGDLVVKKLSELNIEDLKIRPSGGDLRSLGLI